MGTTEHRLTLLDEAFFVSLILKGLDGVLELVGGILLLLVSPHQIGVIAQVLTQHELSEDPHDLIANALLHLTSNLSLSATVFGAIYLLLHGLVKIVLVWALLRGHLAAYPWMIAFLMAFILYQGYQIIVAFSWGLTFLTAFDIFFVYLTWREYGIHKRRRAAKAGDDSTHVPDQTHEP
ncbi:DUF2127 domain-containing protein [Microbacterium sp. STN6]|uniref:DUF2127 domain-containing protein n=1 Tax=Microbacterium sp. STN6 TaxID=2995588 RepID=UPI0022608899|nr:DUF2127 domain-containing protein [Microbacterium sp. STN6]MCX7522724.1 DUF2127 domain-containing protein [Microbacterium sp. STN6]